MAKKTKVGLRGLLKRVKIAPGRGWRLLRRLMVLGVLLLAVYGGGFGLFLALLPEPEVAIPDVDGLAIFTGGSNRVMTGLDMLKQGFPGPVLISGVHPDVKKRELAAMVPISLAQQERLTLDTLALTTRDNVINTLMWADAHGVQQIGMVTSTYHVLRCQMWLWWYGALDRVTVVAVQPGTVGYWPLFKEYNKLLVVPLLLR